MSKTFSQTVETVLSSVPAGASSERVERATRIILAADGSPDAPASLVDPVVDAVLCIQAAEAAGHGGA